MSELSKMTVVNALLQSFYPARFLELSTPLTGNEFERTRTELCARADLAKYRVQDLSEGAGGGPGKAAYRGRFDQLGPPRRHHVATAREPPEVRRDPLRSVPLLCRLAQ